MKLVVFDVDGTLLDNLATEDECFSETLIEVMGIPALDPDWARYEHISDLGIALESYRRVFRHEPSSALIESTIDRFVELLHAAHEHLPITMTSGADALANALPSRGWTMALATGAWRRAAIFKLHAASFPYEDIPMATSEDGPARASIVRCAILRAEAACGVTSFDRVVSVGDGVWDVEAARVLGTPFVGIGSGQRGERLRDAGAACVLADFADIPSTLAALERAHAPEVVRGGIQPARAEAQ